MSALLSCGGSNEEVTVFLRFLKNMGAGSKRHLFFVNAFN